MEDEHGLGELVRAEELRPSEVWHNACPRPGHHVASFATASIGRRGRVVANFLNKILAKFRSFSGVSAPIFASKHVFFSIF